MSVSSTCNKVFKIAIDDYHKVNSVDAQNKNPFKDSLSLEKINNVSSMKVLGNTSNSSSNVSEITLSDNNLLNDNGTVISTQSSIKQ